MAKKVVKKKAKASKKKISKISKKPVKKAAIKKSKKLDINPFLTIWTRPRETIRKILAYNPNYMVLLIVSIAGISSAFDRASLRSLGDTMPMSTILLASLIAGPIMGILGLYISSALLKWTGKWIGGKGSFTEIKAAYAWSELPFAVTLLTWIIILVTVGKEMFTTYTPILESSTALIAIFMATFVIDMILVVWGIVIGVISLSEVQRFSVWKAIGNILLAILIILAAIMVIVLLVIIALAAAGI